MVTRVDAWGLGALWALADLACGEYEPARPLFDPDRWDAPPRPAWWDALSRVWLFAHGNSVWAWACDSRAECAFELTDGKTDWSGRPTPVGVPRAALLDLRGRSPRGGVRCETDGVTLTVSALSCGYTGQVTASKPATFGEMAAPEVVTLSIERVMAAREEARSGTTGGVTLRASAEALGRAFACAGARLNHSFYSPARLTVDRDGRVVVTEVNAGQGCVMRCAARTEDEGWPAEL